MNIELQDNQNFINLPEEFFYKIASLILQEEGHSLNVELSILLVDNKEIQKLNAMYRQIDSPTDVLSFPMMDPAEPLLEDMDNLLGDIVISTEKAIEQAGEKGHKPEEEILILFIHGMLHLLGYDHISDEEAEIMESKEILYREKF